MKPAATPSFRNEIGLRAGLQPGTVESSLAE